MLRNGGVGWMGWGWTQCWWCWWILGNLLIIVCLLVIFNSILFCRRWEAELQFPAFPSALAQSLSLQAKKTILLYCGTLQHDAANTCCLDTQVLWHVLMWMRTKWSAVQMIEQLRLARHTCTSIVKLLLSIEGLLNYGLSGGGGSF